MNRTNVVRVTFCLAALVATTIPSAQSVQGAVDVPHSPPQLHYVLIDLGGYFANAITDSGRIVGSKFFGAERHGAFWPNSQSQGIDLGTLPGFTFSTAANINPRGEMVGGAGQGPARPIFWASNQSAPLQLPGLPVGLSGVASHINPVGQIVGTFFSLDGSVQRPVFWPKNNAAPVYLAELSDNFPHGVAISINPSGNILGDGCDADFVECHVAFWANSASTPVPLASPGGEFIYTDIGLSSGFSVAPALNNAGSMVGYAYNTDFSATRAVFWANSSGPAVMLSTTGDFSNGTAEGINENGQIVGTVYNGDFSDFHAFMWPSSASQGIDLNTLISPDSGWELVVARSVNNRGEIAGAGFLNGAFHAYVLIPVHGPLGRDF